jgi:hypothetical protein
MNKKILYFIVLAVSFVLYECKDKTVTEQLLRDWIGRTIDFPNIEVIYASGKDTVDTVHNLQNYKILCYTDSAGCTKCKLYLDMWKSHINELGSKVAFLFYFYPKDEKELLSMLKSEYFINYPVYIDRNDELNRRNHFLNNPIFQCFLLDKDNRILAIGNPASNPEIWELYKKIITGEISDKPPVTTVKAEQTEIELKNLQTGKTSETVFILKNTGKQPLIIRMVNASCGCTVPDWEKQPIAAGNTTEIKVKITPEKNEYFNKLITVHCNTESGQISLKIKGMVED